MVRFLINYLALWIAIAPSLTLIVVSTYLVTEWYPQPWWVVILSLVVVIHLALGWVFYVAEWSADISDRREEKRNGSSAK